MVAYIEDVAGRWAHENKLHGRASNARVSLFTKKRSQPLFLIQQKKHGFKKTTVSKIVVFVHAKHIKVFKTVASLKTTVFLVKLQKYFVAKISLNCGC